jgi:hypothetical protein
MLNNNYNKNTLEAVTQGSEVGGCPSKILCLLKTTILLIITNNIVYCGELTIDPELYHDHITYKTNEIVNAIQNCEFGFCKPKLVEESKDVVYALVLPDCDKGKCEASKEKYK